jgi:epoxyqueuosine reductase
LLARLRAELAAEGLFIVRPVTQPDLDRCEGGRGLGVSLAALLPGAAAGLVIADGGPTFYQRFRARAGAAGDQADDPLDRHTTVVVPAAIARALAGGPDDVPFVVTYPFLATRPPLPIQRLGEAAGLPPAGPLGLQVHPGFGPWWAYRAFAVFAAPLPAEPPLPPVCPGCPAPCIGACRDDAVTAGGLAVGRCAAHRAADPGCHFTCDARVACIAGPEHRYPEHQLRFHMAASLVHVRRARGA